MLALRSSRCTTHSLARNSVTRQARATLATANEAFTEPRTRPSDPSTFASRRVFFIRPWSGVQSMAHGLAAIRAFELAYGKLRDIRFDKDFEVSEMYLPMIWANFEDDSNFDNLPIQETNIRLTVPSIRDTAPGNASITEVQSLLLPLEKTDSSTATPWDKVLKSLNAHYGGETELREMEVRIGRSQSVKLDFTKWMNDAEPRPRSMTFQRIGSEFYRWGGFYTPEAQRKAQVTSEGEHNPAGGEITTPDDMPHMTSLKRHWARHAERPAAQAENVHGVKPSPEPVQEEVEADELKVEAEVSVSGSPPPKVVAAEAVEEAVGIEHVRSPPSKSARQQKREKLLAIARAGQQKSASRSFATPKVVDFRSAPDKRAQERDRLAAIAHEHTQSPLPEAVIPADPRAEAQAKKAAEEMNKAEEKEAKATILGRLRKLWGW